MKNIKSKMDLITDKKEIKKLEKRAISQHIKAYNFKIEEK